MAQLFQDPLTAILSAIDSQNNVSLVQSQYSFGNPTPWSDPTGQTNTQMVITVTDVTSPYTGSVTVSYSRLALGSLATMLPLPLKMNGVTTILQLLALMNATYGLNFKTDGTDIADGPLTIAGDGSGSIVLTAQPNSLGWIGSVTIPFVAGNYNLATVVTNTALSGILYPDQTVNPTMPFGEFYSYWRDFSSQEAALDVLATSTTDMTALASALTAVTGNTWQPVNADRYSLGGATILYNGPTNAAPTWNAGQSSCNPAFSNVLIVQLNPTTSLGYSGYLIIHYNLPNSDGINS
jgi:hypothetical protein